MTNEYQTISSSSERLGQTLDQLMRQRDIDGVRLSKGTGIPTTTINRLRHGMPNSNPTLLTLLPIAEFFSITVSQLIGETSMAAQPIISSIPLIPWQEAIKPPNLQHKSHLSVFSENIYSKDAFALIVEEDNYQEISKGTLVLIDPQRAPEQGNIILIFRKTQNNTSLKKLLIEESNMFLQSLVYDKHIEKFSEDDQIIGILVEYKKYLLKD